MNHEQPRSLSGGRVVLDRQCVSIDAKLYDAGGVIETCRQEISEVRANLVQTEQKCIAYVQAYHEERQRSAHCSRLCRTLQHEHEAKQLELSDIAQKYFSLQREFEDSQTAVLANDSVVQAYERRLANNEGAEAAAKEGDAKIGVLNERIVQLEKENKNLLDALAKANMVVTTPSVQTSPTDADMGVAAPIESPGDGDGKVKKEEGSDKDDEDGVYHTARPNNKRRKRKVVWAL